MHSIVFFLEDFVMLIMCPFHIDTPFEPAIIFILMQSLL